MNKDEFDGLPVYYRKELLPNDFGVEVYTQIWVCIRDRNTIAFCVCGSDYKTLKYYSENKGLPLWDVLSEYKWIHVKRIHKTGSRFAFSTEEQALQHLKFRKTRQNAHLERQLAMNKAFLNATEFETIYGLTIVPNSQNVTNNYYRFT